jgi:hypothetical protein
MLHAVQSDALQRWKFDVERWMFGWVFPEHSTSNVQRPMFKPKAAEGCRTPKRVALH